jgi:hypothetical protein
MRISHVRAIFEQTLYSAASRHFTRIKINGEDLGPASDSHAVRSYKP